MGIEEEIRQSLLKGISPQQIIQQGFKKSTVYKVHNSLNTVPIPATQPLWWAENIVFNKERYLPGDPVDVRYSLKNGSGLDLYLYRVGVQPEWSLKQNLWYSQELRILLEPGGSKQVVTSFATPSDLTLGEYELRFGLEGQFLNLGTNCYPAVNSTQWTDPVVISIQHPINCRVFISHSVKNVSLIRQLQQYLDNYGIQCLVGEDIPTPGSELEKKFFTMIDRSNYFLAILTNEAISSEWVMREFDYAYRIKKPMLLLKDQEIAIDSPIEWIEFSKDEPIETIIGKVIDSINKIRNGGIDQLLTPLPSPMSPALVTGVIAFLAGLIIAGTKK